ncbi:MAG: hypothetical protein ACKVS9_03735 [Phycisphaerae bacterium]
MSLFQFRAHTCACAIMWSGVAGALGAGEPWADEVISYDAGTVPVGGFTNPAAALGSPELVTGECFDSPNVVSLFSGPFCTDELARMGENGSLVVRFDEPIRNDASNPFGVDLIVFGNAFHIDAEFPHGVIGDGVLFGTDPMRVLVSADGVDFRDLGEYTEGQFPTQAYLDRGPYDDSPGNVLSDFTKPMNPALDTADFAGLSFAQALSLYDGSGGGTPIDISSSGLSEVRFVKILVPEVADASVTVEIDAFATVPEPASATVFVLMISLYGAFRRGIR